MKIGRWEGNEIIYTIDVNGNSVNLMEDFDFTMDILGATMVVSGMIVTEAAVPDMTIQISAGIAEDFTVGTFLIGEALVDTVTTSDPVNDRIDIVEVRRFIEDTTPATRQFKDPITETISDQTIDTKTEYKTEIQVTVGTPAPSPVAPSTTAGWIKIAEILVPAASLTVVDANIYNVDAEKAGVANTGWTADATGNYRNGTISEMKTQIIDNEAQIAINESTLNTIESLLDPISNIKHFANYKDRSASGLLPFAFDNAVSQTTYADLYAEIGDIFEQMHLDAGDAASGGSNFYPTPIPGYYDRSGTPDSDSIDSTADVDDSTERITLTTSNLTALKLTRGIIGTGADGVPVRVKLLTGALPGGLAINTDYFIRFIDTTDIELYTDEASAIDTSGTTNRVDLTDAVGTFQITQEGIVLDDAMQGHFHDWWASVTLTGSAGGGLDQANVPSTAKAVQNSRIKDAKTDTINGDPRTSNETRPKTVFSFGYIKALYVL